MRRASWAKWNTPFSSGPKLPRSLPLPARINRNRKSRIWKIPIQNIPVQENQNWKLPFRWIPGRNRPLLRWKLLNGKILSRLFPHN